MNKELDDYIDSLVEDTNLLLDEYKTPEMAFTATVLDKIEEYIDCSDIIKEHCKTTKSNGDTTGEIYAYSKSTNGEVLYLFYTDYNSNNTVATKTNTASQSSFNRLQGFYNKAIRGIHFDIDSNSPEYRATKFIYDNTNGFQSIKLVLLSNFIINNPELKKIKIAGKPIFSEVWDLKKLYGIAHSMSDHIAIDIDFDTDEYNRYKIPFIQMESTQYGYKCIQAMFPAKLLYQLYEQYNTNLLYNNVRYFLGLKGKKDTKPNVAMLETLRGENEMFLAYNNGITALAKEIESSSIAEKEDVTDADCKSSKQYISIGILKKILDFRIINGGQTTAVIYNSKNLGGTDGKKKVNLVGVYVQVKLIISDEIEKFSGNITLSSNFQNKVKYSDFSVSNTFNTKMEELSRRIISPKSNNQASYWFYERLRGQYDEKRKLLHTKAEIDIFESQFPKTQKFSKEDISKVWLNWEQKPYDAVKGASSTYATFMKERIEVNFIPDESFYKETIALIIIYKFLMSRPENKDYANGKATVVAYAMAMLKYQTLSKFDLIKVWENQDLSDNSKIYLNKLSNEIYNFIDQQARRINSSILSYGKTKGAYDFIKSLTFNTDKHLLDNDKKQS